MYSKRHWRRLIAKSKNNENKCESTELVANICEEENSNSADSEQNIQNIQNIQNNKNLNTNLNTNLKCWAIKHNVSRQCFDDILKIMRKENINVPASSRSIILSQTCVLRTVTPGSYLHIGLKNQLMKLKSVIKNYETISLDINVDGLPLYKSSNLALWPILARIVDQPRIKVFPIGIYLGNKKPYSVNNYLHDFVNEIAYLKESGITIGKKNIKINIRCFICDTPARAFLRQTVGHNAFDGCCKCIQKGQRINNRTVFSKSCDVLRTDENFKERKYASFHKTTVDERLCLENLGIGMISQFPLDPMHLVDLGVTKKILHLLLCGKCVTTKLNQTKKNEISTKLLSLVPFITKEFCRKPRGINEIKRWKATELRQFILYTGVVVLANIVDEHFFYLFCLLHCGYRILMKEQITFSHIETASKMFEYFVESFPLIFPKDQVSFNVHALLHLPQCVANFGTSTSYDFENYLQKLKRQVKKPTHILEQLNNKIFFDNYIVKEEDSVININKSGTITSINMPGFYLSLKTPDKYCYTKSGFAIKIKEFSKDNNILYIKGNKIVNCENYYEKPLQSLDIGIFLSDGDTSATIEIIKYEDISYKLMCLPCDNKFVFFPLLHSNY